MKTTKILIRIGSNQPRFEPDHVKHPYELRALHYTNLFGPSLPIIISFQAAEGATALWVFEVRLRKQSGPWEESSEVCYRRKFKFLKLHLSSRSRHYEESDDVDDYPHHTIYGGHWPGRKRMGGGGEGEWNQNSELRLRMVR
jgi:hypothetical protein